MGAFNYDHGVFRIYFGIRFEQFPMQKGFVHPSITSFSMSFSSEGILWRFYSS